MSDCTISELLRAAHQFDPAAHVPFLCEGTRVGWLRRAHAQRLLEWPDVFKRDARGVRIAEHLTEPGPRTA